MTASPRHDYRRALEAACGAVEVVTIGEAVNLSRARLKGQTVVIVSTIQCFRVEDTTGRKVYSQNGALTAQSAVGEEAPGAGDGIPQRGLAGGKKRGEEPRNKGGGTAAGGLSARTRS